MKVGFFERKTNEAEIRVKRKNRERMNKREREKWRRNIALLYLLYKRSKVRGTNHVHWIAPSSNKCCLLQVSSEQK